MATFWLNLSWSLIAVLPGCIGSLPEPLPPEGNNAALSPPAAVFASEYDARCVTCHGATGAGVAALNVAPIAPGACVSVDCGDVVALSNYIASTMPPPGGSCVDECAAQTAMVVAGFPTQEEEPLPPPSGDANLTPPQRICREQFIADTFPTEMALLCENGEPSSLFLDTLATPYVGGARPAPPLLINESANGISKFATVGAMRIDKPIEAVFAMRDVLNTFNLTAGNATITSAQTAVIAPQGDNHQGGFELRVDTTIRVLIVNVAIDMKQQREFYDLSGDGTIRADLTRLKPADPLNVDNIASNVVGFWIAEGNTTLMINVVLQEVDNQGFPGQALDAFTSLTPALAENSFNLLSE